MIEITFIQVFIFVTILWIFIRRIVVIKKKELSIITELKMLLIYICIVVVFRFVYFNLHLVNGKIGTLKIGFTKNINEMINYIPFHFLFDRYDGWQINIIGNITMFIPIGIVWSVCFTRLDSFIKAVLAGSGFSLFIEITQLFCYERHTDIDDLILNSTGVIIGVFIIFFIRHFKNLNKFIKRKNNTNNTVS